MEVAEQRQRGANRCLAWALEAAKTGSYGQVPKLLEHARAQVNDGELSSLGELYREFFELPPPAASDLAARDAPLTWLGAEGGARLDALHRHLLSCWREAGGEWKGRAMEQRFLLEPSVAHRQVFSDWLQEREDPRGEFIALQMIYADHGLDDRGRARMEWLLSRHKHHWAGPFILRGAEVLVFRRGFPSVIAQRRASVVALSEIGFHWRVVAKVTGRDAPQLRACRHVQDEAV